MSKYLDPKSDVVFKKIFADHPHLLKSFLNAVLLLSEDRQILTLEYLPVEQVPAIPDFKRTIVDVKCQDKIGRIFIVEMQVEWTTGFMQRLLFGTAQAYVKQLKPGESYHLLHPVYGLGLINSVFDNKTSDWYHHYGLVKLTNPTEDLIQGLTLVFVELPKFIPDNHASKKLQVLWLRFMREIDQKTTIVDPALLAIPEIKEAIDLAEAAAYSPAELEYYESYWKMISSEVTLREEAKAEGFAEGKAEGKIEVAKQLLKGGIPVHTVASCTELSEDFIRTLVKTLKES